MFGQRHDGVQCTGIGAGVRHSGDISLSDDATLDRLLDFEAGDQFGFAAALRFAGPELGACGSSSDPRGCGTRNRTLPVGECVFIYEGFVGAEATKVNPHSYLMIRVRPL